MTRSLILLVVVFIGWLSDERASAQVLAGIDVLVENEFQSLQGRRIGLITNQTGLDCNGVSTVDLFLRAGNLQLVALFSPEHGFRGVLEGKVDDARHESGLPIHSLYGETRRRIPLAEAKEAAGGGDAGQALIDRLAGQRTRGASSGRGPLRLITVTKEQPTDDRAGDGDAARDRAPNPGARWANLIHETLIRAATDDQWKPRPYWPTLWHYIERNKHRAARINVS